MTVGLYTAAYLLVLARSGTAGVKDKVDWQDDIIENSTSHDFNERFNR